MLNPLYASDDTQDHARTTCAGNPDRACETFWDWLFPPRSIMLEVAAPVESPKLYKINGKSAYMLGHLAELASDVLVLHKENSFRFTDIFLFKNNKIKQVGSLENGSMADEYCEYISQKNFVYHPCYFTKNLGRHGEQSYGAIILGTKNEALLNILNIDAIHATYGHQS